MAQILKYLSVLPVDTVVAFTERSPSERLPTLHPSTVNVSVGFDQLTLFVTR